MKRRFAGIAAVAVLLLSLLPVVGGFAGVEKVTICHFTSSDSASVVVINVADPAVDEHLEEHGDKVLEPGQTIEDCFETPTPTPTLEPTPTLPPPTPTPTVVPTEIPSTVVVEPTPTPPPTTTPPEVTSIAIECDGTVSFTVSNATSIVDGQYATIIVSNTADPNVGGFTAHYLVNGQSYYTFNSPPFAATSGSLYIVGYIGSQPDPAEGGPVPCG